MLSLWMGVARAEQAESSPGVDPSAGEIRLEGTAPPSTEGEQTQISAGESGDSMAYTRSGWNRYRSQLYREAAGDFQQAISLNPTNASAFFGLGNCQFGLAEYEPAANSYRQYISLRPGAEGHYWLGAALLKLLRFSDAEAAFRQAIHLSPDEPRFYDALGYSLFGLKRYADAIPVYEKALSLGGDSLHRCLNLGVCYFRTRNYPRARELFRKCIGLDPRSFEAHYWLGMAFYQLQSYEAAVAAFQKAIQIKSDDPDAWLELAAAFYRLKSYKQAANAYRKVTQLAPNDFFARYRLGDAYLDLRRFSQAAEAYGEAIRIKPSDFDARYWRGVSLLASLQFAEAIPDLERAHELRPEDADAKYDLFFAYLLSSQFKDASVLYPAGYNLGAAALLLSFGLGVAVLLRKSFKVSAIEGPGLWFTIAWAVISFEGQLVCTFGAGLLGLTFASGSVIVGMITATFPLLFAALTAFPRQPWGSPFARPRSFPWRLFGAGCAGLALVFLANAGYVKLLMAVTGKPLASPRNLPFIEDMMSGHPALSVLAGVVFLPTMEELLFRGLLFGALRKWFGAGWTILITSILFGACHADLVYFIPLIAIGALLGWVRNKTGSVWITVLIHILNNALAFMAT